jgi:hypothetical protein
MFDYIEISKYLSDGCFNDSHINGNGELQDKHGIVKVKLNKKSGYLTIKGSLPYFYQGHNFWFSREDAIKAIDRISHLIEVDLYDAEVKIMEYGVVVCPKFTMIDFLDTHLETKGYEEIIFGKRGKNYEKTGRKYTFKFYSLWSNIDRNWNKVDKKTREMLKKSDYNKENNPMRYEIHGNPQNILGCGQVFVSDLLSKEVETQCNEVLLNEYKKIKKRERLKIDGMRKFDSKWLLLVLLSENNNRYQEVVLKRIDRLNISIHSKNKAKSEFRKKFKEIPHEKCSYSIEDLIVEALKEESKQN